MKINTLIYKMIMKKDLLNRTGGSTEQTVITYMRKKKKQRKDTHLCITESSSCTLKQKHWKSTLPQYKITINYKSHELGLDETRQR